MGEQVVGEIRIFSGNYAPRGWAFCNGQHLNISENEILFSLIGTTYGGDGQSTFALPDLRGRVPVSMGQSPTGTQYPIGQMAGHEFETLQLNHLPNHTHAVFASIQEGTTHNPQNAVWASAKDEIYTHNPQAPFNEMSPASIGSTGGGQHHNNMMPYLTLSFIIALEGYYPNFD